MEGLRDFCYRTVSRQTRVPARRRTHSGRIGSLEGYEAQRCKDNSFFSFFKQTLDNLVEYSKSILFCLDVQHITSESVTMPAASKKEFILRTKAHRPGSGSMSSVQRMYCSIEDGGFRLAGAFTQDTLFS